jgi:hypothetical protein
MSFCPKCRYEYLPEVTTCPDCGSELVDELPDLTEEYKDVKWVALKPLSGMVYAKMVAEVLDQQGIPNYIKSLFGSGAVGVVMGAGFAGASAKIYVPEEHLEEAARIRDEMMKDA